MKNNISAKFDWLVLKPIWIVFIILTIYYFTQRTWLVGILMLIMNFLLGIIAASLHKGKTFHDLAQGYPTRKEATTELAVEPLDKEYYFIGKAFVKLMFLFFIAAFMLTFHYDLKWYFALGISLLISWLGPLFFGIPFFLFLWKLGAKLKY